MRILFDTHALLWFLDDNPRLSTDIRKPFDRMLIAQARKDGFQLLSHDEDVIRYGAGVIGF